MKKTIVCIFLIFLFQSVVFASTSISSEENDLPIRYSEDGLWGFIDSEGNVIIEPQYISVGYFTEDGIADVKRDDGFVGAIDKSGKIVVPFKYKYIGAFHNGRAIASYESSSIATYFFINEKGNIISNKKSPYMWSFSEGYAAYTKNNKVSYLNTDMVFVGGLYDYAENFDNGYARVCNNKKWGMIDKNFENVVDFKYDDIKWYNSGMVAVKKGDMWGMLGDDFEEKIPFVYEDLKNCNGNLIAAKKYGKWGVIDKDGNIVIAYKYDDTSILSDDAIIVTIDGKAGVIDKCEDVILPIEFDKISQLAKGLIKVSKKGEGDGVYDIDGNCIIEPVYSIAAYMGAGWIRLNNNDYINIDSEKTIHRNTSEVQNKEE